MGEIVKAEVKTTVQMYGNDDEIQALGELVKQFAPWAKDLTNVEIGGVVRRVMSMGLDPLNGHEVQIWKDNRKVVQVQPAYTLMIDWVKKFNGDHTQPRYYRLVEEELAEQGLPADAVAYKCTFIMNEDLDRMTTLLNMNVYEPKEIREMFEVSGLGVSLAEEYNAKSKGGVEYFAPTGRSKSWKVEKRALIDAYRHKFGTPSRSEIETLRRQSGTDKITPDDWQGAYEVGADERGTLALAQDSAQQRDKEPMTREEAKTGANALYGDGNGGTVDGVFKDVPSEPDPEPGPQEPEQPGLDLGTQDTNSAEWTRDKLKLQDFWDWAHNEQGLGDADVCDALSVEKITDFTGNLGDAKTRIVGWVGVNAH